MIPIYQKSMMSFNIALAKIDVSVAYAVWSATGTIVVTTAGVLFFHESFTFLKFICVLLIIIGVVGLNMI